MYNCMGEHHYYKKRYDLKHFTIYMLQRKKSTTKIKSVLNTDRMWLNPIKKKN